MRITDILIEQFGVWQDLRLPVHPQGMTVIHGPNEAGKSTLMRFIRGVLYDFPTSATVDRHGVEQRTGWGGSLQFERHGRRHIITRRVDDQGKKQARFAQEDQPLPVRQFEEQLLGVNSDIFQSVFTLGLKELRELSSLHTDQVSEYIYGSSLGRVGQRLLSAEHRVRERATEQTGSQTGLGTLFDLSGRYASIQDALVKTDQILKRYQQTLKDRDRLEQQQRDRRTRLEQLQRDRTGLAYLQRVWSPWKRQRDLRQELLGYEGLSHFPADGLRQLDLLERKLEANQQQLTSQRAEQTRLKKRLAQDRKQYELREHASGIRALIDLRGMVETAERHFAAVSADATMLKAEVDEKLSGLGPGWTIPRLDEIDTSPGAHLQLVNAAKNYQQALSRRVRHRRKYQKVSDANHNRQLDLQEALKRKNVPSIEQGIRQSQQRLKDLEQLTQLRIQESEFEQRIRSAQTLLQKYRDGAELPWWATSMLTLFTMAGGFLVIAGLFKGVQTSWLIGLIYLLTGVMGAGLAWSLRQHYETDDHRVHSKLEYEISDCQRKLNAVRDQISRITGISYNVRAVHKDPETQRVKISESELQTQASQKLQELHELARIEQRILKTRKNLSVQRGKLTTYQKDVSRARQSWCDLLKQLGLRETIRTAEAFQHWQLAVDASQTVMKWKAAREDVQRQSELLAMFREQMQQIAGRMNVSGKTGHSLTQVLSDWQKMLDDYERVRVTYLQQRQQFRDLKTQIEATLREQKRLQADLNILLKSGSASTVEEFRRNAGRLQRAGEIRALLADITDQLNSLGREQPELAIVEEDLQRFNAPQNQERLELITLEIDELETEISRAQEELGRLRQSLNHLESDTQSADLVTRRQRILDDSAESLTTWLAATQAGETFARMTATFEQQFQPETLARASHYLAKLTCGRYEQVRTPFSTRELIIHEASGIKRNVGSLSDGTREQLLLAIRLALVDVLAEDQIELPMVLDDICVNFDQERTEAAVDTVLEFAERRQVLYFTCHRHLAHLFQSRGVEPTWLPGQAVYEAQRRAG